MVGIAGSPGRLRRLVDTAASAGAVRRHNLDRGRLRAGCPWGARWNPANPERSPLGEILGSARVERGKVWVVWRPEGPELLKGRASPSGNRARAWSACSAKGSGGALEARGGNALGEPGICSNRERELGLDRRETG